MKLPWTAAFCLALLLALTECRENKTAVETDPPTDGDFVRYLEGRATARVWGIHFDVAEPKGHASGSEFDGGIHSDPEQTDARIKITMGDDVEIRLEKVPGSPIRFQMNGRPYGGLEVGDKVRIDKDRNVEVNDSARQADGGDPE